MIMIRNLISVPPFTKLISPFNFFKGKVKQLTFYSSVHFNYLPGQKAFSKNNYFQDSRSLNFQ